MACQITQSSTYLVPSGKVIVKTLWPARPSSEVQSSVSVSVAPWLVRIVVMRGIRLASMKTCSSYLMGLPCSCTPTLILSSDQLVKLLDRCFDGRLFANLLC